IGTSNKTERMLGYGTLYGDTASSINPIGDIYKTQVWALSEEIGIPKEIIDKQPSADLWTGQTDEGELGFTYAEADHVLFNMLEMGLTREKIIDGGIKANIVDMIIKKIKTSDFKRCMPLMAEINQGDIQLIS
ncbi:MAG: NAD(+) synthase, partial [Desulfuromonadales bacterium]|nr:NAD(+) synthase [Desulfuromonadales bacterium]